jgi:hypothetical protein
MTGRNIAVVAVWWLVYLTIATVFVMPVPEPLLNAVWFFGWALGVLLLIVMISTSNDMVRSAAEDGKGSARYAELMTKEPLPPFAMSVITASLLFAVSMSAAAAGYWVLAAVYIVVDLVSLSITARRREYDIAARTVRPHVRP